MSFVTYRDLLDDLGAYAGKGVQGAQVAAARTAAQAAVRELPTHHEWNYYRTRTRVVTRAGQTGRVGYVASTRVLTITDGSTAWPAWAPTARLVIDNIEYQVEAVLTSTTARLAAAACPPADLTDRGYQLALDLYPLPDGFSQAEQVAVGDGMGRLCYRQIGTLTGVPLSIGRPGEFSVESYPAATGTLGIRLWPAPDTAVPIEIVYRRRPRLPVLDELRLGPVKVATDGLSLTAEQPLLTARHVGQVVRLGFDAKLPPSGLGGTTPFADERLIDAAADPAHCSWLAAVPVPAGKVQATVSDLIDVEPGAMTTALLYLSRRQLRHALRIKTVGNETGEEQRALAAARDADARYSGSRFVGGHTPGRRLATMPIVPDRS